MNNFRVTSFAVGNRAIQFQSRHNAEILKYQEQISSGIRLQKPSDDPIAFRQISSLTSRLTELYSDRQSLNNAQSILNASAIQIQEYSNVLTRAQSLAQQGIQAFDDNAREALALEVDGLLTQLKDLSNSTFNGAYIYGGTKSSGPPFSFAEPDINGRTLSVSYSGSEKNSRAYVGEAVSIDTYYSGLEIFSNKNRSATVVHGNTGIKSGPGTDTLVGKVELQITHDLTEYQGVSGIQPGTRSASLDSIIGEVGVHSVTIVDTAGDGSAGTISLNGGPEVAFTNADTDLRVESGASGEVVYVDTSAIAAGFNGTVDIRATGSLSVDGGRSKTAIDFTNDQIVSDSETGNFAVLDTVDVTTTGTNTLEFPGTSDAFQLLYDLSVDLRNENGFSNAEAAATLNRRLGELESMHDHALSILGEQSTSLATLESLNFRIEDLEISVETQLVDLQSTDIPEAVLRLENSRSLLQYTYAVTAQISSLGLLDFLR